MTVFEKIKSMDINEFAKWFSENCVHDGDPVITWWDNKYCKNCESEIVHVIEDGREMECAWCEVHDKCRYFTHMDKTPEFDEITKLWLESESK